MSDTEQLLEQLAKHWDVGQAPLTDDRPALALLSRDLVAEHRRQSLEHRRQLSW